MSVDEQAAEILHRTAAQGAAGVDRKDQDPTLAAVFDGYTDQVRALVVDAQQAAVCEFTALVPGFQIDRAVEQAISWVCRVAEARV